MERLDVALSRVARSHDVVAVLFCDLDDFKLVNDGYGHDFADGVLVEVARRLEQLQRKSDTVARIGGDEFVVVCDGLHDVEESTAIASRIRDAIEQPIVIDGHECLITASIGIATVDGAPASDVDPADACCATPTPRCTAPSARAGRTGTASTTRSCQEATRRFELEAELGPALERGEFVLHYQPIHELARPHDRRRRGVPALGASDARLPAAGPVPRDRGADRHDRPDRRVGDAGRVRCRRGAGATRAGRVGCR